MRNPFDLRGRVAVLTGGAGILGSRMARALIAQGATVALIDRDQTHIDNVIASIKAEAQNFGSTASVIHGYVCDITNRDEMVALNDRIISEIGAVDILINNAAAKSPNFFEPFETFPLADWDMVMGVNVKGVMLGCQIFGASMAKCGKGSIINTLSIYGIVAPDQRIYEGSMYEGRQINTPAVYSASKAAVWGMTKYLATYWGHRGVRVNAITPGGVFSGQNDTFVQRYSARVPMGRMAQRDEMSGAIIYLASDASSYVNGQNIVIDGGLTAW
jgi:NAD(P)-dependent dehydrogenase (short-subunit alcohol dehydrogenase family)